MKQQLLTESWKTAYKMAASFFKSNWSLRDYPIEIINQEIQPESDSYSKKYPWEARVLNWYWMRGEGDTREAACSNLQRNFEAYLERGGELPRPGSKAGIVYASVDQINELEPEGLSFSKKSLGWSITACSFQTMHPCLIFVTQNFRFSKRLPGFRRSMELRSVMWKDFALLEFSSG